MFQAPKGSTHYPELCHFLSDTHNALSPQQALDQALQEWLARQRQRTDVAVPQYDGPHPDRHVRLHAAPPDAGGYQWKSLFLPHGTRLRMHHAEAYFYAQVSGDAIIFDGRAVSPRQLTLAIAGDGRNAWRDLWLRLPGDSHWRPASWRRTEALRLGEPKPLSAADSMVAAAACMADALKSALALVEHTRWSEAQNTDRRTRPQRRDEDEQAAICAFE